MTEQKIRYFPAPILEKFMKEVFIELNVPPEDAEICADILIQSDLRGIESHGCQRLKMYYDRIVQGIQSPTTKLTIKKETATTARIDAGHGMGHVAAYRAMELAIKKANEFGIGAISVGNSTHFGQCFFTKDIKDDEWHRIIVTNYGIFIDGQNYTGSCPLPIGSTVALTTNNKPLWIGMTHAESEAGSTIHHPFNGTIDEVRIYNKAIY